MTGTAAPSRRDGGDRPTGVVSFLFTDVEGSTKWWDAHTSAMSDAMARHDEILRSAIDAGAGYVFSTAGDSFGVAFASASGAVDAAVTAQRCLAAEPWPEPITIRVRMGVHTGTADERGGDYFGPTVNHAARIMDAGHGGQILVSDHTLRLLGDHSCVALGAHLLKSLSEPISLHQVEIPGSDCRFPALRSVDRAASTIPTPRSPLVGRAEEVEELTRSVLDNRLVTLAGAGGAGKTRLAIEVASSLIGQLPDGAYFADLSPVTDAELVPAAVARGLGATLGASPPMDTLASQIARKGALLVLDNCEHVIDSVADLVDTLLDRCPHLRVLATSREPLSLQGERLVRLGPMTPEDAASLFATSADPSSIDEADPQLVANLCGRLDHLPLAIELAAAQTHTRSVEDVHRLIFDDLERLHLGRRRGNSRQQTMHATIAWSYELASLADQAALRALSVMPSEFGITTSSGVLSLDRSATADVLERLGNQSLVAVNPSGDVHRRFRLLESIKAFATESCHREGEYDEVAERHARTIGALVADDFVLVGAPTVDFDDDVLQALEWAHDHDDYELGCHLAHLGADILAGRGAFTRLSVLMDWLTRVPDPTLRAAMWSISAWVSNWSLDIVGTSIASANAVEAAPESEGAAAARLSQATILVSSNAELAQFEIDLARPIIDRATKRQLGLRLTWQQTVTHLWSDRLDEAAITARQFHADAARYSIGRWLARSTLLTVMALVGDTEVLTTVIEDEKLGADDFDRLSMMGWSTIRAPDAIALASLGRAEDGRRFLADIWFDRRLVDIPLIHADVIVALAGCAVAAGEVDQASSLLDGTVWLTRYSHTAFYLYRLLADIAGVDETDFSAWRNNEFASRLSIADVIRDENRTEIAINAELARLGLGPVSSVQ